LTLIYENEIYTVMTTILPITTKRTTTSYL